MPPKKTPDSPALPPIWKTCGIVKKGSLYYVVTLKTQGDKVIDTEWNSDGDLLGHAQNALRVQAGRLFWNDIHKEDWGQ